MSSQDPEIMIRTYKDISDAYEVLTDPVNAEITNKASSQTRQSATELRALWAKRSSTPPPAPGQTGEMHSVTGSSDSLRAAKMQAVALEMEIEITLKEALKGIRNRSPSAIRAPVNSVPAETNRQRSHVPAVTAWVITRLNAKKTLICPPAMYGQHGGRAANRGRYDLRAARTAI